MAIDLITGHQSVSHISADQIATINNAMMDNFGANKVMRLVGGELTADGLTITISEGYWRVNGFDMEIQEGETLYIDPTTIGLSRIDDIYVEILQDIPTGAQRAEIYIALGEPSATPTAPDEPTAPYLNTDILLQIIKLASVTVTEGAMVMTDLTIAYEMVTPSELDAVETIATGAQGAASNAQTTANTARTNATNALNMIRSTSSDAYSSSKAYSVGDHVIYNNKVYKCITACSAGPWTTNHNCFEQTTLTGAVTELNSDLGSKSSASAVTGSTAFAKINALNTALDGKQQTLGFNWCYKTLTVSLDSNIGAYKAYAGLNSFSNYSSFSSFNIIEGAFIDGYGYGVVNARLSTDNIVYITTTHANVSVRVDVLQVIYN